MSDEASVPKPSCALAPPAQPERHEAEAGGGPSAPADVMYVHGPTPDGSGVRVVRRREDALELGELRPMQDGKPLHGEVVRLKQRPEHERLFDVEVVVENPERRRAAAGPSGRGPAQVASATYRSNWDRIFGPTSEESPN